MHANHNQSSALIVNEWIGINNMNNKNQDLYFKIAKALDEEIFLLKIQIKILSEKIDKVYEAIEKYGKKEK